ncbi:hypothetical protein [Selenomonas sp. AE3005]|uniref:hypothetical protein n=1 Tax=Selenomonas sp. AE3005 TaxID=1485543 RepID=UPI0025E60FCE|nr:hypothetical protein [Selenomonas sp. AE3005]
MKEEKQELEMENLSKVAGGAENNQQNNSDNSGAQQNTQHGDINNTSHISQVNEVSNNAASVDIGSPVDINNGGNNSVYNIN